MILQNAFDDYFEKDDLRDRRKLPTVIGQICGMVGIRDFHGLYIVVDEAQEAAKKMKAAFQSEESQAEHSILHRLILAFRPYRSLILSGTGLSQTDVQAVTSSFVTKGILSNRVKTDVGLFDKTLIQKKYLLHYLPPHLHDTPMIQRLISRASYWIP